MQLKKSAPLLLKALKIMTSRKFGATSNFIDEDDYPWSDGDDDYDYDYASESDGDGEASASSSPSPALVAPASTTGFSLSDAFRTSATIADSEDRKRPPERTAGVTVDGASVKLSASTSNSSSTAKLRRYDGERRPSGIGGGSGTAGAPDLISALGDDALVLIAKFLPLRSVAALSCVNRFLDVALSSDFLYCRGAGDGEQDLEDAASASGSASAESSGGESASGGSGLEAEEKENLLLLPSLRSVPVLLSAVVGHDRPKGVARKFALESEALGYSRAVLGSDSSQAGGRRTLRLVDQVYGVRADNVTFLDRETIAYTTANSAEVTTRNVLTSKTITWRGPPSSGPCLSSAFATGASAGGAGSAADLCAMITTDADEPTSRKLCLLELASPPSSSGAASLRSTHSVKWSREIKGPFFKKPTLKFSVGEEDYSTGGTTLLVGTAGGCQVLDTQSGQEVWSLRGG